MSAIYSDYQLVQFSPEAKAPNNVAPVMALLNQGYIPIGGASYTGTGRAYQAMAKPTGTLRGGARRTRGAKGKRTRRRR